MKHPIDSTYDHDDTAPIGLCSLHADSGRRVSLPLKAVDVRFEVTGDAAEVQLAQLYEVDAPNPVSVIYVFPLPSNASVYHCEIRVGDRVVKAIAKTTEEARERYTEATAKGHRAALVETLRDNLFELHLGNLQPGDEVHLLFSYVMPLCGDGLTRSLRIPTCPGIRYVPGTPIGADGATNLVPDAGRLNPPRIDQHDPHAALFFCVGTLLHAKQIFSETHPIEIRQMAEPDLQSVMLRCESETPNRDFVLTWETTAAAVAMVSHDDPAHMLCSVMAPDDLPQHRSPRDLFFLLDSSGSMSGNNWQALVSAVTLALAELGESDRVQVNRFASDFSPVTDGLVSSNSTSREKITNALMMHHPNGGTEFTNAFRQTIAQAAKATRPVMIVITDGQFADEQRACEVAEASEIEVHTIGIDSQVNEAVLQKIARRTRGTCFLTQPNSEFSQHIRRLIQNLLSPALERITIQKPWSIVGNPPALRAGQSALIPFRRSSADANSPMPETAEVSMQFSDGTCRHVSLPIRSASGKAPSLLASKAEITALQDANRDDEAIQIACQNNLLCAGVAYVAVDEAEQTTVATAIIEQPAIAPTQGGSSIYRQKFDVQHHFLPIGAVSDGCSPPEHFAVEAMPCCYEMVLHDDDDSFQTPSPSWSLPRDPEKLMAYLSTLGKSIRCFPKHRAWVKLLNHQLLRSIKSQPEQLEIFAELLLIFKTLKSGPKQLPEAIKILEAIKTILDAEAVAAIDQFIKEFDID